MALYYDIILKHNKITGKTVEILFVGRLQRLKDPVKALHTFAEYHALKNAASLIIIGEGDLNSELNMHVKQLNLGNNVFLLGGMSQAQIADFYRASDVLLLTSISEGMPMSIYFARRAR